MVQLYKRFNDIVKLQQKTQC